MHMFLIYLPIISLINLWISCSLKCQKTVTKCPSQSPSNFFHLFCLTNSPSQFGWDLVTAKATVYDSQIIIMKSISSPLCPVDGGIFILEETTRIETFYHGIKVYIDLQWPFPLRGQVDPTRRSIKEPADPLTVEVKDWGLYSSYSPTCRCHWCSHWKHQPVEQSLSLKHLAICAPIINHVTKSLSSFPLAILSMKGC